MRIVAVTNASGRIIGSMRVSEAVPKAGPSGGRFITSSEQQIHELDVPDEFEAIRNPDELHRALEHRLKNRTGR